MKPFDIDKTLELAQFDSERTESKLRELLDENNVPILRDDLYQQKQADILTAYADESAQYVQSIDAEIAQVKQELLLIDGYNPANDLTSDELTRANGLQSLIADDCINAPGATLVQQVQAALRANDRVLCLLYARNLPKRARTRQSTIYLEGETRSVTVSDEYAGQLSALMTQLNSVVYKSAELSNAKAAKTERLTNLNNAKRAIQLMQRRVTGKESTIQKQQRQMIDAWW